MLEISKFQTRQLSSAPKNYNNIVKTKAELSNTKKILSPYKNKRIMDSSTRVAKKVRSIRDTNKIVNDFTDSSLLNINEGMPVIVPDSNDYE